MKTKETVRTLNDWTSVWAQQVLPNVVKETTIQMYTETLDRHVLPSLGNLPLEELTAKVVQEWLLRLQEMPVAGTKNGCMTEGTVRNTLSVLSGCLRDAQKYGLIGQNPCIESAWVLKSKNINDRQDWLSQEQILLLESFLAADREKEDYPVGLGFQLMLYTGITISEAAALRWEDVDFEGEKLTLRYFVAVKYNRYIQEKGYGYTLEPLAGRKQREVPVPGALLEHLHQIQKEYRGKPGEFVLSNSPCEPVSMGRVRAALARKSRACGMGTVTPRMLRDTYAMRAVHAGANSDMIAELMGFSSSRQVIRRYMPKMIMDKRELIKKMFEE